VSEPVLVVRARRLRAARGVVVARDVTLDAAPGEVVAVEEPNGSGKSTLLAAAAGLLPAGNASVRPGSVGYSPERAGVLPRIPLQRWLLVARHPTAPLPLPSGMTWRLRDGAVDSRPRDGDGTQVPAGVEVETGDGVVRLVVEAELPAVLRAALDAGQAIRRVQPAREAAPDLAGEDPGEVAGAAPRRAGAAYRVLYGAAHRAAIPLIPVLTWLSVLAHRVDGRELARAFAAHAGGRARAHLATDLGLVPFAVVLALAALVVPLISQGRYPHPLLLDVRIVGLHLAAAVFGAGLARCSR
jgi:ABC-type cobalamin/Fe3+-siderophores transport system ATPase subunit